MHGKYSEQMGQKLLGVLVEEIAEEFSSVDTQENILTPRHYERIIDDFWIN